MEFEINLLIFRVILPFSITLVAAELIERSGIPRGIRGFLATKAPASRESSTNQLGIELLGLTLFVGALVASELGSRGILFVPGEWTTWEAREPWMHWIWLVPLGCILLSAGRAFGNRIENRRPDSTGNPGYADGNPYWRLGSVSLFAVCLFLFLRQLFPAGAGYEDKSNSIRFAINLSYLATCMNYLAMDLAHRRRIAGGMVWGLVVQAVCVALVVLQGYASLGECMVFATSAILGVAVQLSVRAFFFESQKPVAVGKSIDGEVPPSSPLDRLFQWSLGPLVLCLGCLVATGLNLFQVYTWSPLPGSLLLTLAFLPTLLFVLDLFIERFVSKMMIARCIVFLIAVAATGTFLYFATLQSAPTW